MEFKSGGDGSFLGGGASLKQKNTNIKEEGSTWYKISLLYCIL